LLWDLDPQAASSFLLGTECGGSDAAKAVFAKDIAPSQLIVPTATERLKLLPADKSLRGLDRFLFGLGKKRRLEKLLAGLAGDFERIILDCPPGLTDTSEQVLRAADLIIIPVIPSPLSQRAFDEVITFLDRHSIRRGAALPVYNMVDRRRSMHRAALDARPDWPIIPMASAMEAMSARSGAIGALAPRAPAALALACL
jgi:cellulose biosynthesis protein BcsQ